MNGNAGIGKETQTLAPIIAMLLSLADHASRVSRRSLLVRMFVLWTLRRSEVAMRSWFVGAAGMCSPRTALRLGATPLAGGYRVEDALRLAALFRAMAKALVRLETRFQRRQRNAIVRAQKAAAVQDGAIDLAPDIPEIVKTLRLLALIPAVVSEDKMLPATPVRVLAPDTS